MWLRQFDLRYKIEHASEPTMCDTDIINTIFDVYPFPWT